MTEEEWLAATDPGQGLMVCRTRATDRKLRLLTVSFCRRVLPTGVYPPLLDAITTAEQYADKEVTNRERGRASKACSVYLSSALPIHVYRVGCEACRALRPSVGSDWAVLGMAAAAAIAGRDENHTDDVTWHAERQRQAVLLRDVFGNPFRPANFNPSWRSSAAVALADAMYRSREFDRLPILADALEEAGCDSPDILAHCRGDGPHVRGCWVIDLVLGKC